MFSFFSVTGQKILLDLTEAEAEEAETTLTVTGEVVEKEDLGKAKPSLEESEDDCAAAVSTYGDLQRKPDSYFTLRSASVVKAKLKLADPVNEALCFFTPKERKQCADINQGARQTSFIKKKTLIITQL